MLLFFNPAVEAADEAAAEFAYYLYHVAYQDGGYYGAFAHAYKFFEEDEADDGGDGGH